MGILIPQREAQRLHLQENQQLVVEIIQVENPLKELFGFGKNEKITTKDFHEVRNLLEGDKI